MATQYATASYSEVYDMHTEFGKTTLIGIHTPTTNRWQQYMSGFIRQFKKFRYKGASLSFVPVATLPVDPLAVSYEGGEQQIDPRDMVNPIIHCGMRGQSMGKYLDEIFHFNLEYRLNGLDVANVTNDELIADLENMYYTALSSPAFKKSHPQQGFRKSGLHPMVYNLVTDRPYNYACDPSALNTGAEVDSVATFGVNQNGNTYGNATDGSFLPYSNSATFNPAFQIEVGLDPSTQSTVRRFGQFLTNKCQPLGWLDTVQNFTRQENFGELGYAASTEQWFTSLPKIYMYFVMLPPAYKTELWFRVIIRHFFEFKEYRNVIQPFSLDTINKYAYDGVLETDPVPDEASLKLPTASLDVINGETNLMSDGSS